MRPITNAQRSHLRRLARHVNAASLAQRTAADFLSSMRVEVAELRERRRREGKQLEEHELYYAGNPAYEKTITDLRAKCATLDLMITEANEEILKQEHLTNVLTSASSPLRNLLRDVMQHVDADASDVGLFGTGSAFEDNTTVFESGAERSRSLHSSAVAPRGAA